MNKVLKNYVFNGFGFDVLLRNITLKSIDGADYPDINMNELKKLTIKGLLASRQQLTGYQVKFLRTSIKMSFDQVSEKIYIAASTLRSWEAKGSEFTGFTIEQEKAFRMMVINEVLDTEKNKFNIELTLMTEFHSPDQKAALDL